MRFFLLALVMMGSAAAEHRDVNPFAVPETTAFEKKPVEWRPVAERDVAVRRAYWWSVVALSAATVLDVHSSYRFSGRGYCETNGMLRSSDCGFSHRGMGIKAGAVGVSLALQWGLLRKRPGLAKAFAVGNLATAGVTGAVVVGNYRLGSR
jgi:hypothetical protein